MIDAIAGCRKRLETFVANRVPAEGAFSVGSFFEPIEGRLHLVHFRFEALQQRDVPCSVGVFGALLRGASIIAGQVSDAVWFCHRNTLCLYFRQPRLHVCRLPSYPEVQRHVVTTN